MSSLVDPPPPPHARPPRPLEYTTAIKARATEIDRDPVTYPLGAAWEEDVGPTRYWWRVVEHTTQAATGKHGLFHAVEVWVLEDGPPHVDAFLGSPLFTEGVDASDYQRGADFSKIAAAGKAFAYIKLTEGASGAGSTQRFAPEHWKGAGGAGMMRGGYHFLTTLSDPRAQMRHFVDTLGALDVAPDEVTLPPSLDVEWQIHTPPLGGLAPGDFADRVVVALEELAGLTGRRPLLYTAPAFWTLLPLRPRVAELADLWIAHPGVATSAPVGQWTSWQIWQWTFSGEVPGYPARADCDRFAGDLAALRVWAAGGAGGTTGDVEAGRRILDIARDVDAGREGVDGLDGGPKA